MSLLLSHCFVSIEGKEIVHDVSLSLDAGTVHALMGPNGSGKSTLAYGLSGHPRYAISSGSVTLDGKNITNMKPDERAKAGLFLSFQYPVEIPGVTVQNFLRQSYNAMHGGQVDIVGFHTQLLETLERLHMDTNFAKRSLNEGFSGGEKKRMEMLQMEILEPKYAILDETDSGLDIDALKIVAETVNRARKKGVGLLVITHYSRILTHIAPNAVHILANGKLVKSGDALLAHDIESRGYDPFVNPAGA
jgi:Fe-S cluster assembly ATP-binding protein